MQEVPGSSPVSPTSTLDDEQSLENEPKLLKSYLENTKAVGDVSTALLMLRLPLFTSDLASAGLEGFVKSR
jgi:hypothetical protein